MLTTKTLANTCAMHNFGNCQLWILTLLFCLFYGCSGSQLGVTPHECNSTDVRNDCTQLLQLDGCTVIRGYLTIALLREDCENYDNYTFPHLREITDFLIFYDVKGLKNIRNMFPKLTVIRGRRLFLNYALGVSNMPSLEALEFKSLVAIQRGHVFIGSCPKLCYLDKINWDRLTLSPGQNHIFSATERCALKNDCNGCGSPYCWSNFVCQKFNNDNVSNLKIASQNCDVECLGGCLKAESSDACTVCKNLNDNGNCVKECPADKYLVEHYQRCYTEQQCINMNRYINGTNCVLECPGGDFYLNVTTSHCILCNKADNCSKVCQPKIFGDIFNIYSLSDADYIKGCEILNASLTIFIRNNINELDLMRAFENVKEIRGYLKIYRSSFLTSLKFLRNLRIISGEKLEYEHYGIVIYDNKNLNELWDSTNTTLGRGGIYVHSNSKLCNKELREFNTKIGHDRKFDSLQANDEEFLCGAAELVIDIEAVSHKHVELVWRKNQTLEMVEIIYRPIPNDKLLTESSELEDNICTRINWKRELVFKGDLKQNNTHYSYSVVVTQNTKYAYLIKTFDMNNPDYVRSMLKHVTTLMDKPLVPKVRITNKTDSAFTVHIERASQQETNEVISYYQLELFELSENLDLLDNRDYCQQPAFMYHDSFNEDYDDCCLRLQELSLDNIFSENINAEFKCSLDNNDNCNVSNDADQDKPLQRITLKHNVNIYTFNHLQRFSLYTLHVHACNDVGCGSYSMHSERTKFTYEKNLSVLDDLHACHVPDSTEYQVFFSEPKHPNGLIVSYIIHYRVKVPNKDEYQSHINCVTRLQHAQYNFKNVAHLNTSFAEVAVRVVALSGDNLSKWIRITMCPSAAAADSPNDQHPIRINTFLMFFLVGGALTMVWVCYKRRLWRRLPELRRFLPSMHWNCFKFRRADDDRQVLVEGFETVRFRNSSEEDQVFLNK